MTLHPDCARRPLPLALRDEPRRTSALPWLAAAVLAAVLSCCIVLCEGCGPTSPANAVVDFPTRRAIEQVGCDVAAPAAATLDPGVLAILEAVCSVVLPRYGAHAPSLDAGVE